MDVKLINPFVDAFLNVMPQLGFQEIKKQNVSLKGKNLKSQGVMLNIGIVGDIKGNVVYCLDIEGAKKIASTMMMGFPVTELDDMAQSAISELSNMLTANASTNFSESGVNINISTPTLIFGNDFEAKMNTDKVICINILVDDIPIEINTAFEKL
ncbi:CheY-P phosphatase CheX [Clostridium homopropionicum DSM 5847]|uniref:CheY-P phosphatase CheX n=1 Tax=Clostridium homopropionicum DSM 5847 TaxID=1121318 RepID=A0A0L6Z6J0_9CLOT|nr:chemotaxis protein CheX [Clostridium homopropionicum]KOA18582.1 CheY-P phosphatase CheX [Clostridium homopropionicum DSM 5847]SFG48918.1 chemotaxis protein CheX [Clostridium homopropionicum]